MTGKVDVVVLGSKREMLEEVLRDLGYRIPDESFDELFPEFLKIHQYLVKYYNIVRAS